MKYNRLFILLSLAAVLFVSCKKDHYDVSNVHGMSAEGEMLLPIASKSLSMMDMMQRFKIDSIINCSADGNLSYGFHYEHSGAVKGEELLRFKDLDYTESFSFENPFPYILPESYDTTFNFEQTLTFEADHINVLEAVMRSGRFDFNFDTNIGLLQGGVLRSSDIKDAYGNDLELSFQTNAPFGFDLSGLHYKTNQGNTLNLSYQLDFHLQGSMEPELYFNVDIVGRDLAIQEMKGYVETYSEKSRVDTTFALFPENVSGSLEIDGALLRLNERNTFGLAARLVLDTAMVSGQTITPFSILEPLPVTVNLPTQFSYSEVFNQSLRGKIDAGGGSVFVSSQFTVNPGGLTNLVSVNDTCSIDVIADVDIPFAFVVDDVQYLDTIDMQLSEIDIPGFIERLTLELTFNSTIPLNLSGSFYAYDSQSERITDTLFAEGRLIAASFNGQPTSTRVSVDITEGRVENVMRSDRIIMRYEVDTEAQHVALKADQKLDLFIKAKVKYNGNVEF